MATIKRYTDISQAKILDKILSSKCADMCFKCFEEETYDLIFCEVSYSEWAKEYKVLFDKAGLQVIPCWSLAALLNVLPFPQLSKDKLGSGKVGWMVSIYPDNCRYDSCWHDNSIDACYEMILKLHELKIL